MEVGSRGTLLCLLLLALSGPSRGELIDCDPGACECCVCLPIGMPFLRTCSLLTHQSFAEWPSPPLTEIWPGSFQHADHILSLNLSYNAPPELSLNNESFVGLTNLTELFLQGNDLTSLTDGLLSPMVSLELLNLEHNRLVELGSPAFRNLSKLETLLLGYNNLTAFPADLLQQLPALRHISLHPNPWDCSSEQIATLVQLLRSGIITDGNQLTCDNSTLVSDINIEGPSSTSIPVSPTPSLQQVTSSIQATPTTTASPIPSQQMTSSVQATPTSSFPSQQTTASVQATPTPSPQPTNCSREENVGTAVGFFDWPETAEGGVEVSSCPHGPNGGVAMRECSVEGTWGEVDVVQCNTASPTTQVLLNITQTTISTANSLSVSSLLSSTLTSSPSPLTLDEVEVVLDLTEELLQISGESVQILNNTLQALDSLLNSSGASILEGGSSSTSRLRSLIDTVLLAALSTDQSSLVLTFSHLAVGGVYIRDTNHTHILAIITTSGEGEDLVIGEGGEGGGGDVEVEVEGEIQGPVQVTVYMNTTLFNSTSCGKDEGTKGDDLAPIITVSDEQTTTQETVTLTYHGVQVSEGDDVLCVRWNSSLNCGQGGWQTSGCRLDRWQDNDLVCVCVDNGTFTILETHSSVETESELGGVVKYVFYGCCGLALILYLPVILVVLVSRSLRPLPLKQCTANMAASQALSFIVMAASCYQHTSPELCYSLAVLLHYTLLVSLLWFCVYPVLTLLKVFRRRWFEWPWLLAPIAAVCWVLPAILIAVIGASRYDGHTDGLEICWMEADVFPNYFTYLSVLLVMLSLTFTVLVILTLCCSDYDLELPVHLRVVSAEVNAGLFSVAMICHFIMADAATSGGKYSLDSDYLLLVVAVLVLTCATYFLVANGGANSHIRSTLLCREDPVLKRKVAHYSEPSQTSSSLASSRTSEHRNLRRSAMHLHDEMNLNYVNSYLGYDEVSSSHVPLDMLQQVNQSREGRRVRGDRREMSGPLGPSGFRNVGFKVPHPTSML